MLSSSEIKSFLFMKGYLFLPNVEGRKRALCKRIRFYEGN